MSTLMTPKKLMFSLCAGGCAPGPRRVPRGPRPQLLDGDPVILGRPGHPALVSRVRHQACSVWSVRWGGDGALLGIVQVPAQRVQGLALVELAGDLAPVAGSDRYAGGIDRAPQRPILLERGSQGVLPRTRPTTCRRSARRWPARTSATRPCAAGRPQSGDQVLVPPGGQQRPGVRVPGLLSRPGVVPYQGDLAQVPDPR